MASNQPTVAEWLTTADAVRLLDAPAHESPSLIDAARAPFAFGLLLVPVLILIAGIGGLLHTAMRLFALPTW